MIDNDMTNILRNFAGAEAGTGEITDATGKTKVSTAATEKNAMKSLLEGLDAQQKSVNQMPGTHKMAKNGAKHPAEKFLVGGEFDNETELDDKCPNCGEPGWNNDEGDALCKACGHNTYDGFDDESMDYDHNPDEEDMLGRALLYNIGESNDAPIQPGVNVHVGHHVAGGSGIEGEVTKVDGSDVYIRNAEGQTYKGQLKNTTVNESWMDKPGIGSNNPDLATAIQEKFPEDDMLDIMAWEASAEEYGQPLTIEEYAKWRQLDDEGNIKDTNEDTIAKRTTGSDVHKKQSFKDVFRSMDETEDDMTLRFKKELHDEKTSRALSKGDNGKFNLAEEEDTGWGDEMIEDIKLLIQDARADRRIDLEEELRKIIAIYEK